MSRGLRPLLIALLLVSPAAAAGQEADSIAGMPVDSLTRDTLRPPPGDPRLTWLGDTLSAADTLLPRFSALPEVWPDSLVNPYVRTMPGGHPAWELSGDELVGRGAYSLLDVIESEAPVLGLDLGGGGLQTFVGSPVGTFTNVQVVLDGVPVGSPLEAAWDLRRIPVEAISRVAFHPGARVASWGGEGTGGVLEITTRRSLAPTARSMLSFHLGSFDAQAFSGYFGRRIGPRGSVFVAANFDDTEGLESAGEFTRNQLVMKVGWRFGDRHLVEVARLSDGLTGETNRITVEGSEDRNATLLHAFYRGGLGPVEARVHGYREEFETERAFQYAPVDAPLTLLPGITGSAERTGVRADLAVEWGGLVGWAGGARETSEATSAHPAFGTPGGGNVLDPVPEDDPEAVRIANPRERTEWGAGAGWSHPDVPLAGHLALRRTDFGTGAPEATAWRAEVSGRPITGLTLRASAGAAERPPDRIGQATLAVLAAGDAEIHPLVPADPAALERWRDWRAEASWTGDGLRLTGRAFGAEGKGAFLWAPPSAWLYFDPSATDAFLLGEIPFNAFDVVDLSVAGLEAEAVFPLPVWDLQGRATVRRVEVTEELSDLPAPYVPEIQALGQVRWADRFFPSRDLLVEARLTGRYVGERSTVRVDEELPAFLTTDLLVQASVINFTISVSYKNLLGVGNRAEPTFFLPGREGFLAIVWRFRE